MATTTKAAAPAKKNSGFQGVKAAWIILVICAIAGYSVWYFVMGNPDNFIGGDRSGHPANLLGTVYKGGFVVGLILNSCLHLSGELSEVHLTRSGTDSEETLETKADNGEEQGQDQTYNETSFVNGTQQVSGVSAAIAADEVVGVTHDEIPYTIT